MRACKKQRNCEPIILVCVLDIFRVACANIREIPGETNSREHPFARFGMQLPLCHKRDNAPRMSL
jgi:hypothetical protein